jgi:glycyl-tRNA synthetase beta chain
MKAQDFLVEIGTEELPPKALKALIKSFAATLYNEIDAAGLTYERTASQIFASPRRLAVRIVHLSAVQPDRLIEKAGPFVSHAFTADGAPTQAAVGFAKSNGVALEDLLRVGTEKGDRLMFRSQEKGLAAVELLPAMIEKALHELPTPKRMRWGTKRAEFVRPVHWLVMLYGTEVVECSLMGQRAGRVTRGHRFHSGDKWLEIASPDAYQRLLRDHKVEVCFKLRREKIVAQVEQCALECHGKAVIDRELLDEVTALVEWPVALAGKFEARFLDVPQEALISSMSEHQKYFHVVDDQGGLLPCFITVANIESQDPARVIDGNERVIRPRLTDAAFFYQTDLKVNLAVRREQLKTIIFQSQLGTLYDKTERVASLAGKIAVMIGGNTAWAIRAGELSKADLLSNMVQEFDSMQGIAGSYYATHDGEPQEVAQAIREHYLPRFAGEDVASSLTGCAVAIADRIDTLVGIFGIGQIPSGSKDPFALRRASIGVLSTLLKAKLDIDLRAVIHIACEQYGKTLKESETGETVLVYMLERLRAVCQDEGIATETFNAVQAKGLSNPLDIYHRIQAVHHFTSLPEAESLAAANKRVSNLLAKSQEAVIPERVDPSKLQELAEKDLALAITEKNRTVAPFLITGDYQSALTSMADLQVMIDAFFDGVMVMVDDSALRANRLALLAQLRSLFMQVADVAQLVPEKSR